MQSFSTAEARYEFDIDGRRLFLPAMTIEDIVEVSALSSLDDKTQQMLEFRAIVTTRVGSILRWWERLIPRKSAARLVTELSFTQLGNLYRGWSGMNLGNSSSSSD